MAVGPGVNGDARSEFRGSHGGVKEASEFEPESPASPFELPAPVRRMEAKGLSSAATAVANSPARPLSFRVGQAPHHWPRMAPACFAPFRGPSGVGRLSSL